MDDVRGRQQEHSALMGWPDDHEADLYRDDSPFPDPVRRSGSPDRSAVLGDSRDPQEGSWDE